MRFTSLQEILKFAISKEQASVRFYQEMMTLAANPATKALFEVMIRRELDHVESLQFEMNKFGYTLDADAERGNSGFQWEERLENDETVRDMSFIDALALGIQKERASFRLYAQLLGAVQDEQLGKILMELAEEEMRHVLQLEREYENITHHRDS